MSRTTAAPTANSVSRDSSPSPLRAPVLAAPHVSGAVTAHEMPQEPGN